MRLALFFAGAAFCAAQTPVFVISVDTLRADHVDTRRAPHLMSWAAQGGTLFTAAASQIPLTLPSHTVLMTSTYPYANHVEENAGSVPKSAVTLASVLKSRGYQTAAFIGSIFLERELGLDRGFDTYDSPFRFGAFSRLSGEMLSGGERQQLFGAGTAAGGAGAAGGESVARRATESAGVRVYSSVRCA